MKQISQITIKPTSQPTNQSDTITPKPQSTTSHQLYSADMLDNTWGSQCTAIHVEASASGGRCCDRFLLHCLVS